MTTDGYTRETVAELRTLDDEALLTAFAVSDPHVSALDIRESLDLYPEAARLQLSDHNLDHLPDFVV